MQIYESAEDYLEAILMIQRNKGVVHSVDIANEKNFSKASVSVAMKKLRENGYISMKIAERILERHELLTDLFVALGVSPETAAEDACKVEHDLSVETFEAVKNYVLKHKKVN